MRAATNTKVYSPVGAAVCSALYLAYAFIFATPASLATASLCVVAGQAIYLRTFEPAAFLAKATLPLAVPLVLIHGFLNPQFPVDHRWILHIPIRAEGIAFAGVVSARLLLVAASMAIWRYTTGTSVIGFFTRLRLPPTAIAGITVAISSVELVQRKARAVYLAQQARGYDFRANLRARIVGLPKLIIPVVAATLVEGSERGATMENRGLGSGRWHLPNWYASPSIAQVAGELCSALIAAVAFFIR